MLWEGWAGTDVPFAPSPHPGWPLPPGQGFIPETSIGYSYLISRQLMLCVQARGRRVEGRRGHAHLL